MESTANVFVFFFLLCSIGSSLCRNGISENPTVDDVFYIYVYNTDSCPYVTVPPGCGTEHNCDKSCVTLPNGSPYSHFYCEIIDPTYDDCDEQGCSDWEEAYNSIKYNFFNDGDCDGMPAAESKEYTYVYIEENFNDCETTTGSQGGVRFQVLDRCYESCELPTTPCITKIFEKGTISREVRNQRGYITDYRETSLRFDSETVDALLPGKPDDEYESSYYSECVRTGGTYDFYPESCTSTITPSSNDEFMSYDDDWVIEKCLGWPDDRVIDMSKCEEITDEEDDFMSKFTVPSPPSPPPSSNDDGDDDNSEDGDDNDRDDDNSEDGDDNDRDDDKDRSSSSTFFPSIIFVLVALVATIF